MNHPGAAIHASQRCRERYGIELTPELDRRIRRLIRRRLNRPAHKADNNCMILWRQAGGARSRFAVFVEGKRYNVVYDKAIDRIITFLPERPGAKG